LETEKKDETETDDTQSLSDTGGEVTRGSGRSKKIKTGKLGTSKRLYHEANYSVNQYEDSTDVESMLNRTDK